MYGVRCHASACVLLARTSVMEDEIRKSIQKGLERMEALRRRSRRASISPAYFLACTPAHAGPPLSLLQRACIQQVCFGSVAEVTRARRAILSGGKPTSSGGSGSGSSGLAALLAAAGSRPGDKGARLRGRSIVYQLYNIL